MALSEDAAAKIVLIRSIEECDPRAFSEELRAQAFVAAQDVEPGLSSIERYATRLFEHLSPWYQSILQLAKIPAPWTLPVCFAAFLLGLATNLLGPARQIHVIRNPIFILIAWNLLVFLALVVLFFAVKVKTRNPRMSCALKTVCPIAAPMKASAAPCGTANRKRPGWLSTCCLACGIFFIE